jgi:4-hydroxybenzoate polyprenyltransferase
VNDWLSLLRFGEYGPLFILCGLAGAVFAGGPLGAPTLALLLFIGTFSASAFVENDIADADEDSLIETSRNPIAGGRITKRGASYLFLCLLSISLVSLIALKPTDAVVAFFCYGLYYAYSLGPKFKSMPVVDLLVHGSVPALFVLMGYVLFLPLSVGAVLLSLVVFSFAAMSGTLQELRDVRPDEEFRRTTVTSLGERRGASLSLALAFLGIVLFLVFVVTVQLPAYFLAFALSGYFVVRPLLLMREGTLKPREAIAKIRTAGLLLSLLIMLVYLVVQLLA